MKIIQKEAGKDSAGENIMRAPKEETIAKPYETPLLTGLSDSTL